MMKHDNSNKRRRVCSSSSSSITPAAGGPDYISDLHESMIVNILSRLPILDVIRTSTLSKTWKDKWTLISFDSVHISDKPLVQRYPNGYLIPDFHSRMTKILSLPLPHIKSFTLHCLGVYVEETVQTWISSILLVYKNLESFELSYYDHRVILDLTYQLDHMMSLVKLRLYSQIVIRPFPSSLNFPNLTYLELCRVVFLYESIYEDKVVVMLPALKVCNLVQCCWDGVGSSVELYAPALSVFKSQGRVEHGIQDYSIKLLGSPKLALFEISACLRDNFILTGSTVDCVSLKLDLTEYHGVAADRSAFLYQEISMLQELVNNQLVSSMNHLMLTSNVAEVIVHEHPLPHYDALKRLDISGCVNTGTAMKLLHAMPKLKNLTMDANWYLDDNHDDAMECVPFCVTYTLEEVMFKYYCVGSKHLFHLETFLFKNTTRLKKVSLSISHLLAKDEIVNQLSTSINASTTPTIISREYDVLYVFMRS